MLRWSAAPPKVLPGATAPPLLMSATVFYIISLCMNRNRGVPGKVTNFVAVPESWHCWQSSKLLQCSHPLSYPTVATRPMTLLPQPQAVLAVCEFWDVHVVYSDRQAGLKSFRRALARRRFATRPTSVVIHVRSELISPHSTLCATVCCCCCSCGGGGDGGVTESAGKDIRAAHGAALQSLIFADAVGTRQFVTNCDGLGKRLIMTWR